MADSKSSSKKRLVGIVSIAIGLACAWAIDTWPQYKVPIQATLYTYFVIGPLATGLWSYKGRRGFWAGGLLIVGLHGMVLYLLRSSFPFASVLIVIPIALIEFVLLYVLMLKILGEET